MWIAQWVSPENELLHVLAPVCAILGHNYSVFLLQRDETGKDAFFMAALAAQLRSAAHWEFILPYFPLFFLQAHYSGSQLELQSVTTMLLVLL